MISTHAFTYRAFGFTVASEIPLPELPSIKLDGYLGDITVNITNLEELWLELSSENNNFIINDNFIMFLIPEKAIYLIRNGNEICVMPLTDLNDTYLRLYILGTCMGAILMQRKVLPLHGSAIAIAAFPIMTVAITVARTHARTSIITMTWSITIAIITIIITVIMTLTITHCHSKIQNF